MKPTYLLCFCALLLHFTLVPPTASGSINSCPEGILSYWHLDEDVSGSYVDAVSGFDGTCTDTHCPSPTAADDGAVRGKPAQLFDGDDDMISVPADEMFNWTGNEAFSIELWMKLASDNNSHELIARKDASSPMYWELLVLGDGKTVFSLNDQNGNGTSVTGDKIVDNDVWHHIVVVRDGSQTTLYIDGEAQNSVSFSYSGGFSSNTAPITIGKIEDDTTPRFFKGSLDEVAIYGSALSESDIKAHYYLSRDYCGLYDSAVRIQPMGDSITDDNQNVLSAENPNPTLGNSYRKPLWDTLVGNLFWVDFIGFRHSESDDFDNDHSGFPGIKDDELAVLLETGRNPHDNTDITYPDPYLNELNGYPSDVILLHIGTNGLDDSAADVNDILDQIDQADFRTTVLVARIINRVGGSTLTTAFNDAVEGIVDGRIAEGDKIIKVDMERSTEDGGAGLVYTLHADGGDFHDTLHPFDNGYVKMANQWYATLNTFLPKVTQTPAIQSTPITTANKGQVYSYDVEATGTPPPSFSLSNAPGGMTINEDSGLIQWTPDAVGQVNVVVEAANTGADWGKATQSFTIDVNGVPNAVGDSYTVDEGQTLSKSTAEGVLANDTDEDNDGLTAALVSSTQHGSLSFNSDGSFTYTHDGSETTSDSFTYKASDGKTESAAATVTLTITPVNDLPVITTQPLTEGAVGAVYTYVVGATDADNDSLSWSLDVSPAGMTINADTGEIDWTPDSTGTFDVTVSVSDGNGGVDNQAYQITVSNTSVNDPPVITTQPLTEGTKGKPYTYSAEATDAENDSLTWSLDAGPAGMTINADTGKIDWTPDSVGTFDVKASVSDGHGGVDDQAFQIIVSDAGTDGGGGSGGGGGGGCFIQFLF